MENLYIGSDFSREIVNEDGTAFEAAPYVVLHNLATRTFAVADSVTDSSVGTDKTAYTFLFEQDTTSKMLPGVYVLEIYADSTMAVMLDCDTQYRVVVSSASPHQSNVNPDESESESEAEPEPEAESESESESEAL